jgi:hypothetical protein
VLPAPPVVAVLVNTPAHAMRALLVESQPDTRCAKPPAGPALKAVGFCRRSWPEAMNEFGPAGSNSMIRPWVATPEERAPTVKRVVKVVPVAVTNVAQPRLLAPTV